MSRKEQNDNGLLSDTQAGNATLMAMTRWLTEIQGSSAFRFAENPELF
jgi:hypothetical protein